jgi:hypothetical protein
VKSELTRQLKVQVETARKAQAKKDKELEKLQTRLAQVQADANEKAECEAVLMAELEALRSQVELSEQSWPARERHINAQIEALRKTEIAQRKRFEKLEAKVLAQKDGSPTKSSPKSKTSSRAKSTSRAKLSDKRLAFMEAFYRETESAINQHSKKEAQLQQKIQELCKAETEHVERIEEAKARISELNAVKAEAAEIQPSESACHPDASEVDLSFEVSEPQVELLSPQVDEVKIELSAEEVETSQPVVTVVQTEPASVDLPATEHPADVTTSDIPSLEIVDSVVQTDFSIDREERPEWDQPEVPTHEIETLSKSLDLKEAEKSIQPTSDSASDFSQWTERFRSGDAETRAAAVKRLADLDEDQAFRLVTNLFDDESEEVRNNAARALYDLRPNRAESFTRALREATPERRQRIAKALDGSGLAAEAVNGLSGESRERTYDSFSILFLMAKAGETEMLLKTIENHPNMAIQLSVIKLLTFSNQPDIVARFRSLAVKGALPTEVRSAVMESIYQISSNARQNALSVN